MFPQNDLYMLFANLLWFSPLQIMHWCSSKPRDKTKTEFFVIIIIIIIIILWL